MPSVNQEFYAENGLIVGGNGHIRVAVGNTGQRPSDSAVGSFRYNTDTGAFEGYGANGYGSIGGSGGANTANGVFTGSVEVGNSTSNVFVNTISIQISGNLFMNSSTYYVGNSTVNMTVNSSSLNVGNSTVNSTGWGVGNSTVSVTSNSSTIQISGATINSTSYSGAANTANTANSASFLGTLPSMNNAVDWWSGGTLANKVMTTQQVANTGAYVSVAFGTTITIDGNTGINFTCTISNNCTLGNMVNPVIGRSGIIEIVQDSTGGRTLSLGTNYRTDSGSGLIINTSANRVNGIMYHVRAANIVWLSIPFKGVQ